MKSKVFFLLACVACLTPWISPPMALVAGIAWVLTLSNPLPGEVKAWTPRLLQISVMGLGGAIDLRVVAKVGVQGIGYTIIGILFTMALGALLGRLLSVHRHTSLLVSSGTAICGGSAIAAVSAVLGAGSAEVSVALATVFFLNATALVIFPALGLSLGLGQSEFGLWSALAIHDTSSVIGAAQQYGAEALEIATIVKLARALWIIPLAIGIGWWCKKNGTAGLQKIKKPWFIAGFVLIAAIVTWLPSLRPIGESVAWGAKRSLVLTLFLIGSGLTGATLREVGWRPFVQGFVLWVIVAAGTLGAIQIGWVQ